MTQFTEMLGQCRLRDIDPIGHFPDGQFGVFGEENHNLQPSWICESTKKGGPFLYDPVVVFHNAAACHRICKSLWRDACLVLSDKAFLPGK